MAACVRTATAEDLLGMHACNLRCLPEYETYSMRRYRHHFITWPQLQYVAQDSRGRIVGYVLAVMEEEQGGGLSGYIRSIAVSRPYRRCGLATKLMNATHSAMIEVYEAEYVYLHVRKSNDAARSLFTKALGYIEFKLRPDYFGDGEDAWVMRKLLKKRQTFIHERPRHGCGGHQGLEDIGVLKPGSKREPKAKSRKA